MVAMPLSFLLRHVRRDGRPCDRKCGAMLPLPLPTIHPASVRRGVQRGRPFPSSVMQSPRLRVCTLSIPLKTDLTFTYSAVQHMHAKTGKQGLPDGGQVAFVRMRTQHKAGGGVRIFPYVNRKAAAFLGFGPMFGRYSTDVRSMFQAMFAAILRHALLARVDLSDAVPRK